MRGIRRNLRLRHWHRNSPRDPGETLRTVLHHQGARKRHRTRSGHRLRHRAAIGRTAFASKVHRATAQPSPSTFRAAWKPPLCRILPILHLPFSRTEAGFLWWRTSTPCAKPSQTHLRNHGYRVLAASDGIAALDILARNPDVSILISRPRLCRAWVDANWPGLPPSRVPGLHFIFMSGYADHDFSKDDPDSAESPTVFLQKPFTMEVLLSCIADLSQPDVLASELDRECFACSEISCRNRTSSHGIADPIPPA